MKKSKIVRFPWKRMNREHLYFTLEAAFIHWRLPEVSIKVFFGVLCFLVLTEVNQDAMDFKWKKQQMSEGAFKILDIVFISSDVSSSSFVKPRYSRMLWLKFSLTLHTIISISSFCNFGNPQNLPGVETYLNWVLYWFIKKKLKIKKSESKHPSLVYTQSFKHTHLLMRARAIPVTWK